MSITKAELYLRKFEKMIRGLMVKRQEQVSIW